VSGKSIRPNFRARSVIAVAGTAVAVVVAGPAVASAAPLTGSAGSSELGDGIIDFGSSVVNFGSSVIDFGSSILGSSPGGGGIVPQTQQCNESTRSGGAGVTETIHQIGRTGPTAFVLEHETLNIPDLIEVFYEGARVHSTGFIGDNLNEGTGSALVTIPAGAATSVVVRVTGPADTAWDYTVHCPGS